MNDNNRRRHSRLNHRAVVRIAFNHPPGKTYECDMRDFSSSGVYFNCELAAELNVGEVVEVQTTEFEGAPIVLASVVRIEPGHGFAVEFIAPDSHSTIEE